MCVAAEFISAHPIKLMLGGGKLRSYATEIELMIASFCNRGTKNITMTLAGQSVIFAVACFLLNPTR